MSCALYFTSQGPRGLQGPTGPPGKAGKRVRARFPSTINWEVFGIV